MILVGVGILILVLSMGFGAYNMYSMLGEDAFGRPVAFGFPAAMRRHVLAGFGGFVGLVLILSGIALLVWELLREFVER